MKSKNPRGELWGQCLGYVTLVNFLIFKLGGKGTFAWNYGEDWMGQNQVLVAECLTSRKPAANITCHSWFVIKIDEVTHVGLLGTSYSGPILELWLCDSCWSWDECVAWACGLFLAGKGSRHCSRAGVCIQDVLVLYFRENKAAFRDREIGWLQWNLRM